MSEAFYELWYSLSDLQQKYVMKRLYTPTKASAAEALGIQRVTVYKWPAKVEEALAMLRLNMVEGAWEALRTASVKAAELKAAGLDVEDFDRQQGIASEILDRTLGKGPLHGMDEGGKQIDEVRVVYVNEGD
ncbi:MAG: hypothetical protein O3B43_01690 [Chloroflexi bacterium]|nr:hypothetical protein [Chloroflexota bacterium]